LAKSYILATDGCFLPIASGKKNGILSLHQNLHENKVLTASTIVAPFT